MTETFTFVNQPETTIAPDEWAVAGRLVPCEDFGLRLRGGICELPVKIEVTGRDLQWHSFSASWRVRVRVTFLVDPLSDDEESTTGAWAYRPAR